MTTPDTDTRHDTDAIIEAARLGVELTDLTLGNLYAAPQADGSIRVIDLATDDHRKRLGQEPTRKTGTVALTEAPSFSHYLNDHKDDAATTLWADRDAGRIVAVLNDHVRENDEAGWGDHRATLTLRKTKAWQAWTQASGEFLNQATFAELLEDRSGDVVTPDHATLLEIAQSIEGTKDASFKSAGRDDNGEIKFRYEETVSARAGQAGQLSIPSRIELGIAPFEGMDPYKVSARFRYRVTGQGSILLGVVLDRPEDVLEAAFRAVAVDIETATGLSVMHGTPAS